MDQPRPVAAGELPAERDSGVRPPARILLLLEVLVSRELLLLRRGPSPREEEVVGGRGGAGRVRLRPREKGALGARSARLSRVTGPEDYVANVDAVAAAIAERSVRED